MYQDSLTEQMELTETLEIDFEKVKRHKYTTLGRRNQQCSKGYKDKKMLLAMTLWCTCQSSGEMNTSLEKHCDLLKFT